MIQDGLEYQDSRMSSEEEFKESLSSFFINKPEAQVKGGPVLFRQNDVAYSDPSEAHSLIVGDTGSMKTLRFVLPLIYSCAKAGESMVVVDPKGELARKTSDFLKEQGYSTHIINMRKPQDSPDKWNPMGLVKKSYEKGSKGKSDAILQLNDLFEDLFFNRSSFEKDKYWNETAGQLALGLCGLIQMVGEELNMKNLLKWRYEKLMDGTVKKLYEVLPADDITYQNLAGYLDLTAENTKSCILSTFDQLVRLFKSSADLTEMLSDDTFHLELMGKKKMVVFLVVPDEKTTFHFLATLFVSQCYESLLDTAEESGGRLPVRVNFILEEFCNMPKLPDLVSMLTAARSRNVRFHLVIQSYSQMADKYTENISKTILDNCGNLIYLHTREISFLNYISQLAGYNEYNRPLLSTSRLQHLKKNETVIFHDRCYPFITQDIPLIFEYSIKLGNKITSAKNCLRNPDETLFELKLRESNKK